MALLTLSLTPEISEAVSLRKFMMPGDLISGHKKLEENCDNCHSSFDKKQQKKRCLACHKKVAADVRNKEGFHGKHPLVARDECKVCHTDHKGRNMDIIKFNPQTFNHDLTDLPLHGRHKAVSCDSCHESGKKFREASTACYTCHKKQDRHKGRLGKSCKRCHNEEGWAKTSFDHNRTRFHLTGKHKQVQCNECHPNEKYKGVPMKCVSCHSVNDVHKGTMGAKCDSCHTTEGWKKQRFDHDKKTKFPLRGRHAEIECDACHKKDPYKHKTSMACYSCHKSDDIHQNALGTKCETCHVDKEWKTIRFDHDRDTKFRLKDKHQKVVCLACHKPGKDSLKPGKKCIDCHKSDDVHKNQQGDRCEKCHSEAGWRKNVQFDHGLTRFPLLGLHAITPCESCHLGNSYKDAKTTCISCHKKDDTHKGHLGPQCETCHNQNDWKVWQFNHDTQTDFKLTGAHKTANCLSCHTGPDIKAKLSTQCADCHAGDDKHNGNFGKLCNNCHTTNKFTEIRMNQ